MVFLESASIFFLWFKIYNDFNVFKIFYLFYENNESAAILKIIKVPKTCDGKFTAHFFQITNTGFTLTQLNQFYLNQFEFQPIKSVDLFDWPIRRPDSNPWFNLS